MNVHVLNNLPLCHFSRFTSTRADNLADGIKSTSVLRAEWEYEGLGRTEVLFRRTSFENSSGILNPRNPNHCKGKPSLPRGAGGMAHDQLCYLCHPWIHHHREVRGDLAGLSRHGNLPDSRFQILSERISPTHLK